MDNEKRGAPMPSRRRRVTTAARFALRPIACSFLVAHATGAWGNPTTPQVISGSVQFQGLGTSDLRVTNSPNAIVNWQGFSIGAGELTRFIQQSSASAVLNRVVGADISRIHGQLLSNGRVFLVNPAGIVIGAGGVIDTAGFVGSTLNMLDADFLAGKLKFAGDGSAGSIINGGWIKAASGANVMLVAPSIQNSGVIQTGGGNIVLAAGQKVTIGSPRLEGIEFEVQAPTDSVLNLGRLLADGGAVGVFAGTLTHSGDIRANALARDEAGHIVLKAKGDTLLTGNSTISATGPKGGTVHVLGKQVGLVDSTTLDVSGERAGGTILVGGDYRGGNPLVQNAWRTFVGRDVTLRSDARVAGDGGKVIVWADDITRAYGTITARGGAQSGNGGFVEVSGKEWLDFDARVDASASRGAAGTLLLDPKFLEVSDDGVVEDYNPGINNLFANNAGGTTRIRASGANSVSTAAANVELQANTDITFASSVNLPAARSLTARAGRSITLNAGVELRTTRAPILLRANDPAADANNRDTDQVATLTMAPTSSIAATGGGGVVQLQVGAGPGPGGQQSGNIVLANVTGETISVLHNGPNGSILRADANSKLTASTAVHLQLEGPRLGNSIGTDAEPIRIDTPALEALVTQAFGGLYVDSPDVRDLEIGGVPTAVYGGPVRGVQNFNAGPVRLRVNGKLTQLPGNAICGSGPAGATGGPICAGQPGPPPVAGDNVTLRASDMEIEMPILGHRVELLTPVGSNADIFVGSDPGAAGLHINQTEINTISAVNRLTFGDAHARDVTFVSNVNVPVNVAVTAGRNIVSGAGTTDLTMTNIASNGVTLNAATIGATGAAGRVQIAPGTGAVTATSTTGGVFLEHDGGDASMANYTLTAAANQAIEFQTGDGNITNVGSLGSATTGAITLTAGQTTPGAIRDISFTGGTIAGTSLTLNATRFIAFDSGTTTVNAPATLNGPLAVDGGTVNFNGAVTVPAGNTATIDSGAVNFNAAAASTIAGTITITGGTLGGTGAGLVTGNGGLTFNGGTMSQSGGGLRIPGTTTINAGSPTLAGTLSTGILNITGATLGITGAGVLTLTTNAASTLSNATVNNAGRFNYATGGDTLLLNNGTVFNNQAGSIFDVQGDFAVRTTAAAGTFNNAGTVSKSAGGSTGGFDIADNFTFNNSAGTLTSSSGTLAIAVSGAHSGAFTVGGGAVHLVGGTHTFGNNSSIAGTLTLSAGTLDIPNGATSTLNGTLQWDNTAAIQGPGTLAIGGAGVLNISGANARTLSNVTVSNAGTVNYNSNGDDLRLDNGATFNNLGAGLFDILENRNVVNTAGAAGTFNNAGTVRKSGGGVAGGFNTATSVAFNNTGGTLTSNAGTLGIATSGTHTGAFTANGTSAVSILGGTQTFSDGSTIEGTLGLSGGTLAVPAGTVTLNGTLNWNGVSTISGPGTLVNASNTINVTGANQRVLSNVTLRNAGTFNYNSNGNDLRLDNGATFNNLAAGVFDIQENRNIVNAAGAAGTFNNAGTVRKSGGGLIGGFNTATSVVFNNTGGTLTSNAGTLGIATSGTHTGAFTANGTATVSILGGTQTFAGGSSIAGTLALSGGTLSVPTGNVTLNGTLNWNGVSTISGPGTVANANTINITGASARTLSNVTVSNAGTVNYNSNGDDLRLNDGAIFNNLGAGTFDIQENRNVVNTSGTGTFNNAGTVLKSGGGVIGGFNTASSVVFNNTGGTLTSNVGTLGIATNGTHTGVFTANGTGAVSILGRTQTFADGSTIEGTLGLSGGTLAVPAGTVTLNGTLNWNGVSTISGPGTFANANTINITGANARTLSNVTVSNAATVNYITNGDDLRLDNGAIFNNLGTGTFDIQENRNVVNTAGAAGTFNNAGTVLKSGGGVIGGFNTASSVVFNNTGGTLTSNAGTLGIATDGMHTGVFTANGTGTVSILGRTQTFTNGSSIAGTLGLFGGTLAVPTGTVTLNGTLNWNGVSTVSGPGTFANANTINISLANARTLSNVTVSNAGTVNYNSNGDDLRLNDGAVFNNLAGATFNIQENRNVVSTSGTGTFNNAGTVLKSGGGVIGGFNTASSVVFNNNNGGTLTSNAGTLGIATSGTHTGVFTANGTGVVSILGGTQTFADGSAIEGTLSLAAGTLAVPAGATATLNGTLNWNGVSTIAGPGTLVNASNTINVSGANQRVLSNVTLRNAGTFNYNSNGDDLWLNDGAIFNNLATGTFNILENRSVVHNAGAAATFNNAGTVTKSGGGVTGGFAGSVPITNTGTLSVTSGTLQAPLVNNTNDGIIEIAAGTVFTTNGAALTNASTGTIGGEGTLNATTVTNNGILRPGRPAPAADTTGTLTITGALVQGAGGRLNVEFDALVPGNSDVLAVNGNATLGGTINISTVGGTPTVGAVYTPLTSAARSGLFETVTKSFANPKTTTAYTATSAQFTIGGGAVNTWLNDNGNWGSSGNWSLGTVPGPGEQANINVPGGPFTVTIGAGNFTPDSLFSNQNITLAGGNLTLANASTINGTLSMNSGMLAGTGALTVNTLNLAGGNLASTGGVNVTGTTTINAGAPQISGTFLTGALNYTGGTLTVANGGRLELTGAGASTVDARPLTVNAGGTLRLTGAGGLLLNNGAALNSAGTVDFNGDADILNTAGAGTFNNTGTLIKSAGTDVSAIGSIARPLTFANSGTLNAAVGTIDYASLNTFNAGTQFTGGGATNLVTNDSVFNGNITISDLTLQSGNFSGTATFAGSPIWTGGTITGAFTFPTGASLDITGAGTRTLTGTVNNAGTVAYNTTGNDLLIGNGGVFNNQAGGIFDIQGDIFARGAGTGAFNNAGTVLKSGGTAAGMGGFDATLPFNNASGLINAQTGAFELRGGGTHSGQFRTAGNGVNLNGGTHVMTGGSSIEGLTFLNGGAVLQLNGVTTVNSTLTWNGAGTMTNGTLLVAPSGTFNIIGSGDHVLSGASVANRGSAIYDTGGNDLLIDNSSIFANQAGSSFDIRGDIFARVAAGTGSFNNAGTVLKSGGTGSGGFDTTLPVTNSGTFNAQTGTIQFGASGNVFNNGTQFIGAGMNVVANDSTFNGTITSNGLTLQQGNYGGNATFAGTTTWTGGTMTGAFTVPGGAALNLTGAGSKFVSGGSLANAGTANVSGAGDLVLNNGATIANSGTLDFQTNAGVQHVSGGTPTFTNSGTLRKSAGAGVTAIGITNPLNFTNATTGTVHVLSGTVRVNGGFAANSGTIRVDTGTTFSTNGAALANNGSLRGTGTIDLSGATLTNNGTVSPGASPGTMVINGNYVQGPNGTLLIELAGTQQGVDHDYLQVNGAAHLDGTLRVVALPPFTGTPGDDFRFMTYASRTGDFQTFNYPLGAQFNASPGATAYEIALIVPSVEPSTGGAAAQNDVQTLNDQALAALGSAERRKEGEETGSDALCK